jgi:putative ABC transport system permease protein
LNVVIGVAAVIGTLVILLTMYTTVTERTRQIGILKSLGMSKAGIAGLITKEALLISFLGVILGVAMAMPLPLVLAQTSSSMQVSFELKWILLTLAGGLAGGALGALYPAIRAARMEAVDALSYE